MHTCQLIIGDRVPREEIIRAVAAAVEGAEPTPDAVLLPNTAVWFFELDEEYAANLAVDFRIEAKTLVLLNLPSEADAGPEVGQAVRAISAITDADLLLMFNDDTEILRREAGRFRVIDPDWTDILEGAGLL